MANNKTIGRGKFVGYTLALVIPAARHNGGGYVVGGWLVVTVAERL
jgi:hypothetical protein